MKPSSIVAAAVALGTLAACQSITYQKAGATPEQVEADTKACQEYQLRRLLSVSDDYIENMDRDEFEKPCMEARGYKQVMVPSRSWRPGFPGAVYLSSQTSSKREPL